MTDPVTFRALTAADVARVADIYPTGCSTGRRPS